MKSIKSSSSAIKKSIMSALDKMTPVQQKKIYDFTVEILITGNHSIKGKDLLRFNGLLKNDMAREIREAIEKECERVDASAW